MAEFILLLHMRPANWQTLEVAEMQRIIAKYRTWSQDLGAKGKLKGGFKLTDTAVRHMTRADNRVVVADGPYAEAKDAIGGLFVLDAADMAEAEAMAQSCPHLDLGWIELRQVDDLGQR